VLKVVFFGLSGQVTVPGEWARVKRSRDVVSGSETLQNAFSERFNRFVRQQQHERGWDVTQDLEAVEQAVMRRLWNDLHRQEVETQRPGCVAWFTTKFELALNFAWSSRNQLQTRTPGDLNESKINPDELMTTVLAILGSVAPSALHGWLADARAGSDRWLEAFIAVAWPVCDAKGFDRETFDTLVSMAEFVVTRLSR
jgi:hypothetical protein